MKRRLFLFALWFLAGCTSKSGPVSTLPSTNREALARLIDLPDGVGQVLWLAKPVTQPGLGPTDWTLEAILELHPETSRKILDSMPETPGSRSFPISLVQNWHPSGLRGLLKTNADQTLTLSTGCRDASLFYKSPLLDGFAIPFDRGERIFIHLGTR